MSYILDELDLQYEIKDMPRDGDCFYHSVSYSVNYMLDVQQIRSIVAKSLLEQDVQIYNVINETNLSLDELKDQIRKPHLIWADNIEINALCRALPRLRFFIFDEQSCTIYKFENIDGCTKHNTNVFLRRNHEHFESIVFKDNISCKKILKKMKFADFMNINTDGTISKALLIISCFLPLFIIFKFLYNPLQNR